MAKHTILIIEDNQSLRELYQKVLVDNDYEVEVAADGAEGLTKLQKGGHELVLLDMMLPQLNGIDVLKELKAHPVPADKQPNGTIILMSNLSEDALIKEAEGLGAASHIVKTEITPDVLLSHVKNALNSQVGV